MKDKYKIISASILSLFAVLSGSASIISMPENLFFLKTLFIILGIVLICLAIIVFLSYYFDFFTAFSILKSIKRLGITRISEKGIGSDELKYRLSHAKNIKIITTTGSIFFRTCEEELISALINNARISIINSSMNSVFNKEAEDSQGRMRGEINDELNHVTAHLNRIKQEAFNKSNGNTTGIINIKQFSTQYRFPIIIIDDEFVWLILSLPPNRSMHCPSIEVIKKDSSLLLICNKHFDDLWASLPSDKEINKMTFEKFFEGFWKLEWHMDNQNSGFEYFIIKDNKYYSNGEHWFNVDQVHFDYILKKVSFRKVSVRQNDDRKLVNTLTIKNDNKLEGIESDNTQVTYYRG